MPSSPSLHACLNIAAPSPSKCSLKTIPSRLLSVPAHPLDESPNGPLWIHEIKHDGFRTILTVDAGKPSRATGLTGRTTIGRS